MDEMWERQLHGNSTSVGVVLGLAPRFVSSFWMQHTASLVGTEPRRWQVVLVMGQVCSEEGGTVCD